MAEGVRWDLSSFFPEFDCAERTNFRDEILKDLGLLIEKAGKTEPLSGSNYDAWEKMFISGEKIFSRCLHYATYIECLCSANADNEDYQKESGVLAQIDAEFQKLDVEFKRALKNIADDEFKDFLARPAIAPVQYFFKRLREEAQRTMAPELEALTADLGIDGVSAWGRLYNCVTAKLDFEMEYPDGRKERVPMSQRRSLMEEADRGIREAAFRGGNIEWARIEDVMASTMNHIAGTRLLLNRRRKVDHFLDVALFQSKISQKTLAALFEAIHAGIELPRKIGLAKAKALGIKQLAWFDIEAPLPLKDSEKKPWNEGIKIVENSFKKVSPELALFFKELLKNKWIESEPRKGKRPGAYCTGSPLTEEPRIFMTYTGTPAAVQTLAHEVGHAYHSHCMKGMRLYSQFYPMTLAETASTFAESILCDGMLESPGIADSQKAEILNLTLGNVISFLMDIPVRFEFEKAFYEERMNGEVGVSRLKELMSETQRRIFGKALAKGGEDPYFWASKLHFHLTDVSFYNFPYAFGFLLSRAIFTTYKEEGESFLPKYLEFLRFSGSDTAERVARKCLGWDIEKSSFWAAVIKSYEKELKLFEKLLPKVLS